MIAAMILSLVSCGSLQSAHQSPAADFPFRHGAFDLKVAWRTSPIDKNLFIDGLVKNVRYLQIEDVELTVSVINGGNKVVASNRTFLVPSPINMDHSAPFGLKLSNVTLSRGDILRFLIKYRANDGGPGTFEWLSSFKVDALSGAAINEEVVNPDGW
jgi:hypothetical protein